MGLNKRSGPEEVLSEKDHREISLGSTLSLPRCLSVWRNNHRAEIWVEKTENRVHEEQFMGLK